MDNVTPQVLAAAFDNAAKFFEENPALDLIAALAHATTTAQCNGIPGFQVFRDTRAAVSAEVHPLSLTDFNDTASRNKVLAVLAECRKKVSNEVD